MKIRLSFLIALTFIFFGNSSFSHPGRTDSNGGHYNRSTSVYHCHSNACSDLTGDEAINNKGMGVITIDQPPFIIVTAMLAQI